MTEASNWGEPADPYARVMARVERAMELATHWDGPYSMQTVLLRLDDLAALKRHWSTALRLNPNDPVQVEAVARGLCYFYGYGADQLRDGDVTWHAYIGQARVVIDSLAKVAKP